jgi:hypothetical protein
VTRGETGLSVIGGRIRAASQAAVLRARERCQQAARVRRLSAETSERYAQTRCDLAETKVESQHLRSDVHERMIPRNGMMTSRGR